MRKRRRGGIRQRANSFYPHIELGGQRYWGPACASQDEAERWLVQKESDFVLGKPMVEEPPAQATHEEVPFDALCGLYKLHKIVRWSAGTVRHFDEIVLKRLIPKFGSRPASSITSAEILVWLGGLIHEDKATRKKGQVSGVQVNMMRQALSAIFKHGVRHYELRANPMDKIEKYPEKLGRKFAMRAHELRAFLEAAGEDRLFWAMLAYTGLRQAEMFRMKWDWIDLPGRRLLVKEPKRRHKRQKSADDHQVLPLASPLIELLKAAWRSEGYVFPGRKRRYLHELDPMKPLVSGAKNRQLQTIAKRAGLEKLGITLHVFRHTFSTLLSRELRVEYPLVQALMRHAPTDVTQGYIHESLDSMRRSIEALVSLVEGSSKVVPMRGLRLA